MSASRQDTTSDRAPKRRFDVHARLTELCAQVGASVGVLPLEHDGEEGMMDALTSALDRVVTEHRGMANELISAYEQLGIVFEVTRALPSFHSEKQIVEVFVGSLKNSFAGRTVQSISLNDDRNWRLPDSMGAYDDWLLSLLDRAVTNGGSIVEPPPESCKGDVAEALVCPVVSGQSLVCVILLTRPDCEAEFRAADMMLVDSLTTFCGDLIRNLRLLEEVRSLSISMVRALVSAVDQKDEYTCGHSLRVAYFADLLGQRVGLSEEALQMLQWSALLHDVGKIGIRDSVLKKPGKLTDEEFAHIKEHPTRSATIVRDIPQLAEALGGILHHHERFDGRGYPDGLAGQDVPLQARIIQIADIFDALTSDRSYRAAYDWAQALEILQKEAGVAVDPELQGVFDAMMREQLSSDPEAWDRMIDHANAYTQHSL